MNDDNIFKKAAYTSIGLMLLGAQKAERLIKGIGEKANLPESEVKHYIDKWATEADAARENFKYAMREEVKTYLKRMDIPTREEYDKLQQQILILQQEIDALKLKKPDGPK
jgi:polyhydroxyalkanoate synthesis regulator phasin